MPDMSSNANRMEIRHNWDMLMPRKTHRELQKHAMYSHELVGSGSVKIPDWKQHPMLGQPIVTDPIRTGAIFEASWTHALHCVSFLKLHMYFTQTELAPSCTTPWIHTTNWW